MTTTLEIPDDLHARLNDQAQKHRRTLNQEAIHCLEVVVQFARHLPADTRTAPHESERDDWLSLSERALMQTWDNPADDVFNELLAK
jgi:hypothetical protein